MTAVFCGENRAVKLPAIGLLAILFGPISLLAQNSPNDSDWPTYNRDLAGTRFSPLTQINTTNVSNLREAWSYELGRNTTTGDLGGGSQFTPLVIDGVMYLAGADHVVALDATTGAEQWRFALNQGAPSRRGLAYWPGEGEHSPMVLITIGQLLVALLPEEQTSTTRIMPVFYLGAPVIYENLLLIGSNTPPGSVRAFDLRDGSEAWVFNSTPGPGELGHETWENDAWQNQPNLFHWAFSLTVDEEREIVYAAFESAGPSDYYGGERPGNNLFSDSIVALNVRTGERLWHYQTIHHDIWDFDLPAAPGLLDVEIDGENVPILALAGKTGYMYILNRETGEPVFGIEEKPVPQSNVPGEQSSPTQPIPIKPPPIAKITFTPEDIVTATDTTEAHAQFCQRIYEESGGFFNDGPFTPYMYRESGSLAPSTIIFPGSIGGANWGGTAADPTLGYIFVNTMNEGSFGWIEEQTGSPGSYVRNSVHGPLSRFWWNETSANSGGSALSGGEAAWPCTKPPWANLIAVNAATGDIAWQVPLGITEELPADRQNTGRLGMGGPIATAGGLVFIGATNDQRFRAFDSKTGEELWATRLDMSAFAVPITYQGRDGKQYVAVVAAAASALNDPKPDAAQKLIVFALP
jgi:glucose dehydrogenase